MCLCNLYVCVERNVGLEEKQGKESPDQRPVRGPFNGFLSTRKCLGVSQVHYIHHAIHEVGSWKNE